MLDKHSNECYNIAADSDNIQMIARVAQQTEVAVSKNVFETATFVLYL